PMRVGERAADADDLAVGHHRFSLEYVVHGKAVFQAVGTAGVLGNVPADRADLLTRRVRRIVIAERRHLSRDLEIGHTGFDGDTLVWNVDVDDAIQSGETDDDPAGHWKRSPRQSSAMPARDKRNPC